MAKESSSQRTYTVPLRKEFQKVPQWRKTKKAVCALRSFLARHMKAETVLLSKELNEQIWKHGAKNPPHHVKVVVEKKGTVATAHLFGVEPATKTAPVQKKKKEVPQQKPSSVDAVAEST